jgi:hypothetical protein
MNYGWVCLFRPSLKSSPQKDSAAIVCLFNSVLRIRDVYPGSRIRLFSNPDPGSRILIKEFKYFNPKLAKKWFLSSKKYYPGCSSRIPDPGTGCWLSPIPDNGSRIQGSKKHPIPDPRSRIRIRNTDLIYRGDILDFFSTLYNTLSSAVPRDFTVSEDTGIEPRTVATTALAVRRSNHSARFHPQSDRSHP